MSKSLKKLIDINRLREFKNKLVGAGSAYVQTAAIDQTIAGTKTFSKPIVGSVTGSSGSCTGNAATATKATQDSAGQQIDTTYIKGLAVSGRTITYTKGDGTTGAITTQDTNTDTKVTQTVTTTNTEYPVLFSADANKTATSTTTARFSSNIKINPSTNTITATTFKGNLTGNVTGNASTATTATTAKACTGNAATATKATQDSDGNKITTTYSKNGHTHDDRYYTEAEVNNLLAGKANSSHTHPYIPTSASCNKNWHWKGQGGQPTWLWGGEDGTNMYVYNPSNFRVNYANSANSAVTAANGVDSSGNDWIRFRNGIQICWAKISCGPVGSSTWTYSASFSSRPVVVVCDQGADNKVIYLTRAADIRTASCSIVMVNESSGSYMPGEAQCMAIGRWK